MGLSYKALYENIATNEKAFGLNNVASTLNEAAKEFKLALQNAKSLQQQYGKKIKEVYFKFYPKVNFANIHNRSKL